MREERDSEVTLIFRESLDKQQNFESQRKCLLQETELFKCEKNLAQEKLEQLNNESQIKVNELEKVHFYDLADSFHQT